MHWLLLSSPWKRNVSLGLFEVAYSSSQWNVFPGHSPVLPPRIWQQEPQNPYSPQKASAPLRSTKQPPVPLGTTTFQSIQGRTIHGPSMNTVKPHILVTHLFQIRNAGPRKHFLLSCDIFVMFTEWYILPLPFSEYTMLWLWSVKGHGHNASPL